MNRRGFVVLCSSLAVTACYGQAAAPYQKPDPSGSFAAAPAQLPAPATPNTAAVKPNLEFHIVSEHQVRLIHLRPLFTTAIKLPAAVSSIAVGAPTLFEAEHKDSEPTIVMVKPSTHQAAESNMFISLVNGDTISMQLISPGDAGSSTPVDFVVDFRAPKSLFDDANILGPLGTAGSGNAGNLSVTLPPQGALGPQAPSPRYPTNTGGVTTAQALGAQGAVGVPRWVTPTELSKLIKENALAPNNIALALGQVRQEGDIMTVSFSVMNTSNHWLTIMPPKVDLTNPLITKKQAKKKGNFAQPVFSDDYKLNTPKLAPGDRTDGSITFEKPDTKNAAEGLLLHIATSASIDTPVYYPLPFVAPSTEELMQKQQEAASGN